MGRVLSPRGGGGATPRVLGRQLPLPPPPIPRRAPAVPRSMEIQDVITPVRDTPVLYRCMDHPSGHHDPGPISKRLEFSDGDSSSSSLSTKMVSHSEQSTDSSTDDTASTVSLHDSGMPDDLEETWNQLGLMALDTQVQPRRCRQLDTPSTEASSHYSLDSGRLSISSGCHTPLATNCWPGAPRGGASRSQSAPHMHVLVCICSNVRQFIITILL